MQGKGTESPDVYEFAKLRFLDIANIHVVRASYDALRVSRTVASHAHTEGGTAGGVRDRLGAALVEHG